MFAHSAKVMLDHDERLRRLNHVGGNTFLETILRIIMVWQLGERRDHWPDQG